MVALQDELRRRALRVAGRKDRCQLWGERSQEVCGFLGFLLSGFLGFLLLYVFLFRCFF